jgi:hypothetical protein
MRRLPSVIALVLVAGATARCAMVSGLSTLDVDPFFASDAGSDDAQDAGGDAQDAGCACVSIPSGWTAIRFASSTNVACPTGDTSADVVLGPVQATATGTCTCTCAPVIDCSAPSLEIYVSPTCGNFDGPLKAVTNGTCQPMTPGLVGNDGARALFANASCTATPAPFPAASTGTGRRCTPPASTTCAPGQACAGASGAFAACIAQDGDVACPTGWDKKTTAAASVTDGRTCTGCSCSVSNNTPACSYDVKSYHTNGCTQVQSAATLTTSGICNVWTTDLYYTATAKVTATCNAKNGNAAGSTTVTGLQTICCK